jgi:multidrug efflux pump subunit AcrB
MSINVVSLFAFIVVLGIVVDDAIIVGESIYRVENAGQPRLEAAIEGSRQVARPVVFAVLTTVAAFFPLLTIPGSLGRIMAVIPTIVISVLLFSLIESLLILPNHLSHGKSRKEPSGNALTSAWDAIQGKVEQGLAFVINRIYSPLLDACLRWRYLSVAASLAIILATCGLFMGGWIKFHFMPKVDADNAVAFVSMPQGTPAEITRRAARRLERSARELEAQLRAEGHSQGEGVFRHICSSLGSLPYREAQDNRGGRAAGFSGSHLCEVNIELAPAEERTVNSNEIARRWRELTGPIADSTEVTYTASFFNTGDAVNVDLAAGNPEELGAAAGRLKAELAKLEAVYDITDSFRPGKRELQLRIRDDAEHFGLSQADLGRQVRQGFYGLEAQRILRGRDEIRVMIRYPDSERRSLSDIENMRVRARDGSEVPFRSVANIEYGRGFAAINRADRRRITTVKADVDKAVASSEAITARIEEEIMPGILADFPSVHYSMEGEQRERMESLGGLKKGFALALFMIFILLAIPFKSYLQPLIIMSVIPLGLVAAVWGHIFMGMDMTIFSMFGLVALTGVLVNDSLVMVDFINQSRNAGGGTFETIVTAGRVRFRPILLTSLTTFAGLTPLLLERSIQARFLIPMAVSLGFGVLFATAISLVMVPVGYLILEDFRALFGGHTDEDEKTGLQQVLDPVATPAAPPQL